MAGNESLAVVERELNAVNRSLKEAQARVQELGIKGPYDAIDKALDEVLRALIDVRLARHEERKARR